MFQAHYYLLDSGYLQALAFKSWLYRYPDGETESNVIRSGLESWTIIRVAPLGVQSAVFDLPSRVNSAHTTAVRVIPMLSQLSSSSSSPPPRSIR
jgi:hypothetical protein